MIGCDANDPLGGDMKFLALAVVAATMCAGTAQAATIYTDFAAFSAATSGATTFTFPASVLNTEPKTYTQSGVMFDLTAAFSTGIGQDGAFDNAIYLAAQGGSLVLKSTTNAFGLYIGSNSGQTSFNYNVNGTSGTVATPSNAGSTSKFIGFTDTKPLSVLFNLNDDREFDITSFVTASLPAVVPPVVTPPIVTLPAAAVPEPTTWAMMILGFGLVGGTMRRRKHRMSVRYA